MRRGRLILAWLAGVVLAGLVATLIPPMQSPDEHSHILRAYMLSTGQVLLQTPPGGSSGGQMNSGLLLFMRPYLQNIVQGQAKHLEPEERRSTHQLRWSDKDVFFPIPGTGYYLPAIYLPHAAGLALGQALDLTVVQSYRIARLLCIAASAALLLAAFRILRPPALALALLLLPMTAFQLAEPTVDGVTTALAVLALSLFVRRALDAAPVPVPGWHSWVLAGSLFLLATTRVHLFPLLLLPLWLAWRQRSRRDAIAGILALVLSLAWTGYALTHTVDQRVQRDHSTGELVKHFVLHPVEFLQLVWASCTDPVLRKDYADSFIGVLAWRDTRLAASWYPLLWIGLALCAAASLVQARLRTAPAPRAVLVVLAAGCFALIFFALLVTWTPFPAKTIEGIQGRYFIVPALALAYAGARPAGAPRPARWPLALVASFAACALYALITALLARYH